MADFCLECFKRFEPNANEDNTILSDYLDFCEGCRKMKQIVFEVNENKKPMQVVNSIQDDFCGVPCDFMENIINSQAKTIKRQSTEIERLTNKCNDCAGCTQWKCDCSNIKIQAYEECIAQLDAEIESSDKYIREYDDSELQKAYNKGLRDALKALKEMVDEDNG